METTFRGVQVSLLIVVAMSRHVPRLQRTRAKWTFHTTRPYSAIKFCFVQEPMFDVGFLTSSHFDAYVSDRLAFAARRYSEWIIGSRPSCGPSIVQTTTSASGNPVYVQSSPKTCTTTSWGAMPPRSSMSACCSSLTAIVSASATVINGRQTRSTRIVLMTMAMIVVPTYPVYRQLHRSSQVTPIGLGGWSGCDFSNSQ